MKEEKVHELKESGYAKPIFKELTQEQIDDIHSRGKLRQKRK